jgi:hypothetical protein
MNDSEYWDRVAEMVKAMARYALQYPERHEWTIQGFGMLRTYFGEGVRLHIWDDDHAVPDVSPIHDHPWDFSSLVLSGQLINHKYIRADTIGEDYQQALIQCGEGGGLMGELSVVRLFAQPPHVIRAGKGYHQRADELHTTEAIPGTVSVITRDFVKDDRNHATVCWPSGPWVSAEPRPATDIEVKTFVEKALEVWQ